jgi:hypothetical protein
VTAGDPWANDWRERAGRIILDPTGPDGRPLTTPTDRRWLWRIETFLGVSGTTEDQRQLGRDLHQYLAETCEHHWSLPRGGEDGDVPRHRQCLWCSAVDWLAAGASSEERVSD